MPHLCVNKLSHNLLRQRFAAGAKPLPNAMLTDSQLDFSEQIQAIIKSICEMFVHENTLQNAVS